MPETGPLPRPSKADRAKVAEHGQWYRCGDDHEFAIRGDYPTRAPQCAVCGTITCRPIAQPVVMDDAWSAHNGVPSFGWVDATNTFDADCGVSLGDGPYPSIVRVEVDAGSLLSHDARTLGLALVRLADAADILDARRLGD